MARLKLDPDALRVDRAGSVFGSRPSIGCCGRGSRAHGTAGARPFTSSNRKRSSRGTVAAVACSGPGRVAIQRAVHRNACVERVIGSIRRECLDHVIVTTAAGLHRVLTAYVG
jgi:hypothetical protein